MFERLSDEARLVLLRAQDEASALCHAAIGTEHLLLGLLRAHGIAGAAIEAAGLRLDGARHRVEELAPRGGRPSGGPLPFTAAATRVFQHALAHAVAAGAPAITGPHLLLGLLDEPGEAGARVLAEAADDLGVLRATAQEAASGAPVAIVRPEPPAKGDGGATAVARLTEAARRAVALAHQEASALGQPSVATEHVLLGLLGEREGVAAAALVRAGVDDEAVRSRIRPPETPAAIAALAGGRIALTPRAERALRRSLREALAAGRAEVDSEHLLLGILQDADAGATRILTQLGHDEEGLRDEVARVLEERGRAASRRPRIDDRAWRVVSEARLGRTVPEIAAALELSEREVREALSSVVSALRAL